MGVADDVVDEDLEAVPLGAVLEEEEAPALAW